MNKTVSYLILFLSFSISSVAQTSNWSTLSLVRYESKYDVNTGIEKITPEFNQRVYDLNGQEIELKGYLVPLDGKKNQSTFIFSAFPFSSCFFCGGAGPDSVIEVRLKKGKTIKYSDTQITIKGTFKLKPQTKEGIFYALDKAFLVND